MRQVVAGQSLRWQPATGWTQGDWPQGGDTPSCVVEASSIPFVVLGVFTFVSRMARGITAVRRLASLRK